MGGFKCKSLPGGSFKNETIPESGLKSTLKPSLGVVSYGKLILGGLKSPTLHRSAFKNENLSRVVSHVNHSWSDFKSDFLPGIGTKSETFHVGSLKCETSSSWFQKLSDGCQEKEIQQIMAQLTT